MARREDLRLADWLASVETNAGAAVSFIDPSGLSVTRRLNGGSEAVFSLEARDPKVGDLAIASRAIAIYRNGVIRIRGRIWEPLVYKPDSVRVEVKDPWFNLEHRRVRTTTRYTATDAGTIAWGLINDQNTIATTRIRQGAISASVNHDRTYERGKPVAEAIKQLSEVINGFWFRIDPVDGVPGTHGELVVLYPSSGTTRAGVKLEYGEDTIANIEDYEVDVFLPRNRVTVTGALLEGETETTATATNAASITTYDLFDEEMAFTTIETPGVLQEHADDEVRANPVKTYSITFGQSAPMLWDDFDVGDVLSFYIKNGEFKESGTARVVEASVEVTSEGSERVKSLVIQPE